MLFDKLASAIHNNVRSGLQGYHHNPSISIEQIKDDIVDERLIIMKEYSLKGILPVKDLLLSINCIDVDCKDIEKCSQCRNNFSGTPTAHFEIPQVLMDYGDNAIAYIGAIDKQKPFKVYTSLNSFSSNKYKRFGKNKPFVYIDVTPNENGMNDCFIFNAPLLKKISVVAIFKDPRQLEEYGCCNELSDDNFSFINNEIKKRLSEKYIRYYRQIAPPNTPNTQTYTA